MTEEFKAGKIAAFQEMQTYATSMTLTDPAPLPWLDMALFASTGVDELTLGDPVTELNVVDSFHG